MLRLFRPSDQQSARDAALLDVCAEHLARATGRLNILRQIDPTRTEHWLSYLELERRCTAARMNRAAHQPLTLAQRRAWRRVLRQTERLLLDLRVGEHAATAVYSRLP